MDFTRAGAGAVRLKETDNSKNFAVSYYEACPTDSAVGSSGKSLAHDWRYEKKSTSQAIAENPNLSHARSRVSVCVSKLK